MMELLPDNSLGQWVMVWLGGWLIASLSTAFTDLRDGAQLLGSLIYLAVTAACVAGWAFFKMTVNMWEYLA